MCIKCSLLLPCVWSSVAEKIREPCFPLYVLGLPLVVEMEEGLNTFWCAFCVDFADDDDYERLEDEGDVPFLPPRLRLSCLGR